MPAPINANQMKRAAAEAAAALVSSGMIVGLGSGSTAALAVDALGRRVRDGLSITGIPTSESTAERARSLGIPLTNLGDHPSIDLTIDGADEVERGTLNLIKGHGGALLREKLVAVATAKLIIVVDESKLVDRLGSHFTIPIEIVPFGWQTTAARLAAAGASYEMRKAPSGEPFLSDGGHYILDCGFGPDRDSASLATTLDGIVGVVEHGLFLGLTSQVIIGTPEGVRVMESAR